MCFVFLAELFGDANPERTSCYHGNIVSEKRSCKKMYRYPKKSNNEKKVRRDHVLRYKPAGGGRGRAIVAFVVALLMLMTMTGAYSGANGSAVYAAGVTYRVGDIEELETALIDASMLPGVKIIIDRAINDVVDRTLILPKDATLEIAAGGSLALMEGGVVAGPPQSPLWTGPAFVIDGKVIIDAGGKVDWSGVDAQANRMVVVTSTASIELNGGTFKLPDPGLVVPVLPMEGALLSYKAGETLNVSVKADPVDGGTYKELSKIDKQTSGRSPYVWTGSQGWVQAAKVSGGRAVSEIKAVFATDPTDGAVGRIGESIRAGAGHIRAAKIRAASHGESVPAKARIEIDAGRGTSPSDVLLRIDRDTESIISEALSEGVTKLLLRTDHGDIELDASALDAIAAKAGVGAFRMRIAPGTLDAANASIYAAPTEVSFSSGDPREPMGDVDGNVTLTLPYDCGDPANASTVKPYLISGSLVTRMAGATYDVAAKTVRFTAKAVGTFAFKQNHTVYFDPQNGSPKVKASVPGGAPASSFAPSPTREGHVFAGWYTGATGGGKIADSATVTGDVTWYAHWTPVIPATPMTPATSVPAPVGYTVTFMDGSAVVKTVSLPADSRLGTLPARSRKGYDFKGWYTESKGGTKISPDTQAGSNVTYYARWTAKKYKITLNANGGKVSGKKTKAITKSYDSRIKSLTKATRKGYAFKGWYTKRKGGSKVTAVTVKKKVTYYAHWTRSVRVARIVNTHAVNLRSKPTVTSSVNAVVKRGKTVEYLGRSGSWYKVKYDKKVGYLYQRYVKL
jgi:uncharacterized repeat protein (TIGR02543 family)